MSGALILPKGMDFLNMDYLPTLGWFQGSMQIDVPYMESLGCDLE